MLKITLDRNHPDRVIVAKWATLEGRGATCEEALANLGRRLDELRVELLDAVRDDARNEYGWGQIIEPTST